MKELELLAIYREGLQGIMEGKGLPYLCLLLSKEMMCPVIVTDNTSRIIIYQDVTNEGPELSAFFDSTEFQAEVRSYPIYGGDAARTEGVLFLLLQRKILAWEEALIKVICQLVGLQINNERQQLAIEKKYRNEFVYDILHNNIDTKQTLIRRGKFWGWDLDLYYSVIVIKLQMEQNENARSKFEKTYSLVQHFVNRDGEMIVVTNEDEILILCPQKKSKKEHKIAISNKMEALSTLVLESANTVPTIGVGKLAESMELYRSYHEAKTTIQVKVSLGKMKGIAFYEDLGIMRLLISVGDYKLQTFTEEILAPLLSLEEGRTDELMITLNTYFDNNENQKQTAEDLFIHGNTLKYRLNSVQEILGLNLKNLESKLNLYLALKCHQMQNKTKTSE